MNGSMLAVASAFQTAVTGAKEMKLPVVWKTPSEAEYRARLLRSALIVCGAALGGSVPLGVLLFVMGSGARVFAMIPWGVGVLIAGVVALIWWLQARGYRDPGETWAVSHEDVKVRAMDGGEVCIRWEDARVVGVVTMRHRTQLMVMGITLSRASAPEVEVLSLGDTHPAASEPFMTNLMRYAMGRMRESGVLRF